MTIEHTQLKFERACLEYVQAVYNAYNPVKDEERRKQFLALYETYGVQDTEYFVTRLLAHIAEGSTKTFCIDRDSQDNTPHLLIDPTDIRAVGILYPVDYELVARSAGIQPWSKRTARV